MKTIARVLFISILVLVVFPRWGDTCLPDFPQVIFTRPSGPDKPMSNFANGQIGIPLPTWRRAFLVVAYRYLDQKPLSKSEQRSLVAFFDEVGVRDRPATDVSINRWINARSKYQAGPKPKISSYRNGTSSYYEYENCLAPAFDNAVQVLRERSKTFGVQSTQLTQWITAQDAVFENCKAGPSIPGRLPEGANSLLRADREYQIAAANFYANRLPDALREFDVIAQDASSPWHLLAPYLAVRTIIRQASVAVSPGTADEYDPATLAKAEPRLAAIVSNPNLRSFHQDAQRLQALVRFHMHPEKRQHELAHILLSGRSGSDFGQELLDYKLLLDRFLDNSPEFPDVPSYGLEYDERLKSWKRSRYEKLQKERSDDLSDWLMTVQSDAAEAKSHAVSRWKRTGSTPWLFAAMAKLDGKDAAVPEVLEAASRIPEASSAFTAVAFHRSRLLRESGQPEAAREVVEAALHQIDSLPVSAANLLKDEQMRNAANLASFQARLARSPVEVTTVSDYDGEDSFCYQSKSCNLAFYGVAQPKAKSALLPHFDLSVAEALNKRVPIDFLAEVATSESLPDNLRQALAVSAWARAVLLGNFAAAQKVGETAALLRPELKPFIDQYDSAQTDDERHFVAVFAIAHFPGLRPFVEDGYVRTTPFQRIDDYRDNWWCDDVGGIPDDLNFSKQYDGSLRRVTQLNQRLEASSPVFLTSEQEAQASSEWKHLLSLGSAADYLPREIVAWAKMHPEDPRVPEALHFAWRAARYGCSADDGTSKTSWLHDVFKLLHKRYPNSEWTKKTAVW
jgi:hypothetical protein